MNRIPPQLPEETAPRGRRTACGRGTEEGHERGGEEKARGVDPQCRGRAERRNSTLRSALPRASTPAGSPPESRTLHGHSGRVHDVREEGSAGSGARRVEQRAHERESQRRRSSIPTVECGRYRRDGARAGGSRPRRAVRNPSRSTITPPKNAARTIGRKLKRRRGPSTPRSRSSSARTTGSPAAPPRCRTERLRLRRRARTAVRASSGARLVGKAAERTVTTIRRAVNLVVYVSDALRVDHLGCCRARF